MQIGAPGAIGGKDTSMPHTSTKPPRPPRRAVILGLAAASAGTPAFAKPRLTPLFDGKTLDGWAAMGTANWAVREGVIVADQGGPGFLVSADSYRDFDLRAEVWISPEANSGIFIRCSDRARITAANAYEVNLFDARPDPTYGTGAIVDVAKVSPMPKAGSRWNVMEIRAREDVLTVRLNGRTTVDAVRNAAHAQGPIALQYGAGVVKFRRVDVRAL